MTHLAVHEWGRVSIGRDGFSRAEAKRLTAAAKAHRLGGEDGQRILSDHQTHLRTRQCVGVLAANDCSIEILPKVDPKAPDPEAATVRAQLIRMLDAALGLDISEGEIAPLARQNTTLLDIFIRVFADRLLSQARQGLPRAYQPVEDDVRALRGRLNVPRQFTLNAVRPDRLACRFDELSPDTPLMQIMRACVTFLSSQAKSRETQRLLAELRLVLEDVRDIPVESLPWQSVRINRTNRRWMTLLQLARLFLAREWQATHHDLKSDRDSLSLLFQMNDLFEATTAKLLRRALAPMGLDVVTQGGFRNCLGQWTENAPCTGEYFRTKPDIIIRAGGRTVAIIDTKWKCLSTAEDERNRGIAQADVYQLMAYSQLYQCDRLMLLYPHHAALGNEGVQEDYGIAVPNRHPVARLRVATVDVARDLEAVTKTLPPLVMGLGIEF